MSTEKKVRADAVLKNLPEDRQAAIFEQLGKETLAAVQKGLREDGLRVSQQTLSEFRSWYALRSTLKEAENDAENFLELVRKDFPELPEGKVTELGSVYFNLQAIKTQDPKLFLAMQTAQHRAQMDKLKFEQRERQIQQRQESLQIEKQKLELDFQKYRDQVAEAKQAIEAEVKAAKGGGLSAEALKKIEEAASIL